MRLLGIMKKRHRKGFDSRHLHQKNRIGKPFFAVCYTFVIHFYFGQNLKRLSTMRTNSSHILYEKLYIVLCGGREHTSTRFPSFLTGLILCTEIGFIKERHTFNRVCLFLLSFLIFSYHFMMI